MGCRLDEVDGELAIPRADLRHKSACVGCSEKSKKKKKKKKKKEASKDHKKTF